MATVRLDIAEGNSGRFGVDGRWEFERVATVSGLSLAGAAQLKEAVEANGMPAHLSSHPTVTNCRLEEFIPRHVSPGVVEVRMVYREKDEADAQNGTIETGATLVQQSVNENAYGELMTAAWLGDGSAYQIQNGQVSVMFPQPTLVYSRREALDPGSNAELYVGAVNSVGWRLKPQAAAHTWLCTGIVGRTDDNMESYDVTYTFQKAADVDWRVTVVAKDPETGKVPSDIGDGSSDIQLAIHDAANGVWQVQGGAAHSFTDGEVYPVNVSVFPADEPIAQPLVKRQTYWLSAGDEAGANLTTQFRLHATKEGAVAGNAVVGGLQDPLPSQHYIQPGIVTFEVYPEYDFANLNL